MLPETTATPVTHVPCSHEPKKNVVPEMPPHWVFERDKHPEHWYSSYWHLFTHFLYRTFCVIGLGHADLETVWETTHPDCPVEIWEAGRNSLRERLEHVNLVVRSRRTIDEQLVGLNCDVWPRPVCSSLRWRRSARRILLGTQDYCHIRRSAPTASSLYLSASHLEA